MEIQVCLNKRYAGPRGNFGPGTVIRVDESEAKALEEAGAAERVSKLVPFTEIKEETKRESRKEKAINRAAAKRETAEE